MQYKIEIKRITPREGKDYPLEETVYEQSVETEKDIITRVVATVNYLSLPETDDHSDLFITTR